MMFGLESEKFIFNLKTGMPSKGVFSFLDALSDFHRIHGKDSVDTRVTNEFVLSMVEIGTAPSHSPMEVLKDYLTNYLMIQSIASREEVTLTPLASLPMDYLPHMTPKWAYYVQNSILAEKKQKGWMMEKSSPLRAAGNCAGIHVHTEIETPPEFLFSSSELKNKFNMGLMLTPLIAFASSPYFFGRHEANSMRGLRYYSGVYRKHPLNGGLPNVMETSVDVLNYTKESSEHWMKEALRLGFKKAEIQALTATKGANWNPVRWNCRWNTIELRCIESDLVSLEASKFIWICSSMKRFDVEGEALETETLKSVKKLDRRMIAESLDVSGKRVSILPSHALRELFDRAILHGTKDPLVEQYLHCLSAFVKPSLEPEYKWIFKILQRVLDKHQSTSDVILKKTRGKKRITNEYAGQIVREAINEQDKVALALKRYVPEVFQQLEEMVPQVTARKKRA
jgi:hypothetical protein